MPGKESGWLPSPQFTVIDETLPSGSFVEKFTVTVWPTSIGFGDGPDTVTIGDLSFIVIVVEAWLTEPLLSLTEIVRVKILDVALPVLL